MKVTHKLCGAALIAVAGVALAVPNTTKADDKTGTGHIQFTFDTGTTGVIPTDPGESDGTTITNVPDVTNPGEFGIIAVTPLEFEAHDVLTATNKRDYDASFFVANPASTDPEYPEFKVQNFVKYQDLRTQAAHAYSLSAKITQQFTDTASGYALNGSSITYKNVRVTQTGAPELDPTGVQSGGGTITVDNSFEFIKNTGEDGKGFGQFELNFGDKTEKAQSATSGEASVTMNIPTATAVGAGDYNAVITWTLSETI